jgi:hypothetical protein
MKATEKYMTNHHVERHMLNLDTNGSYDAHTWEAIDRDVSRAMQHGMNKIRKLYESPFSPQITQARLQWRFYKVHLSMMCNHLDLRRQLKSISSTMAETLPEPRNTEEAQTLLKAAQKNVKVLNNKSALLYITYLEEQAMLMEGNNDPKAADV